MPINTAESLFDTRQPEMLGATAPNPFPEDDLIYFLPNIIYLTLYQGWV